MAATAWVIWLCACVSYWPDRGLVLSVSLAFIVAFSQLKLRPPEPRDIAGNLTINDQVLEDGLFSRPRANIRELKHEHF